MKNVAINWGVTGKDLGGSEKFSEGAVSTPESEWCGDDHPSEPGTGRPCSRASLSNSCKY